MTLPRFYPILDVETFHRRGGDPVEAARAIIEGGALILQWRSKEALTRDHLARAERVARFCRDMSVQFVVKDRADLAMLVAAGLHIGQEDLPAPAARRLVGEDAILGLSTHNAEQLREAGSSGVRLDYLALGPLFRTTSKENPDPAIGCDQCREWRGLTTLPLVAIGGINRVNARDVLDAGADSVAVIWDLVPDPYSPLALCRRVEEWMELVNR